MGDVYGFGFVPWGSGLYDCIVERNAGYLYISDPEKRNTGVLFAVYIRSSDDPVAAQRVEGAVFRDKFVQLAGTGTAFVSNDLSDEVAGHVVFEGNTFKGSAPFVGLADTKRHVFATLAEWKGQPTNGKHARRAFSLGEVKKLKPRDLPKFLASLTR